MKKSEIPKVAVIILNYNGVHWLEKFLPSVVAHTPVELAKVWVADNASTDNSLEYIRTNFPSVSTVSMQENYGFSGGYNQAIGHIEAEYILLLNSDVEVSHGYLQPLVKCLDSHKDTAVCQGKILDYNHPDRFEYAGAAGGFIDHYGYPFCRGRIFDTLESDYGQYDQASEIFWASGACMLVRRSLYLQSGGLDVDFFAHMEEIDLCWRLKNMGYSIRYVPESKVYHVGGGTLNAQSSKKLFLNFRNNRLMLFKNLSTGDIFMINFTRNMLDMLAIIMSLLKLKFSDAGSIIKAHFAYLRSLNKYTRKRAEVEYLSKKLKIGSPNSKGKYMGSIVWAYFLRKKKHFKNLDLQSKLS